MIGVWSLLFVELSGEKVYRVRMPWFKIVKNCYRSHVQYTSFSLSSMALFSSSWSFLPVSLDFISLATICFKYCFLSFSSLGVVNNRSNRIALNVVISSIIVFPSTDRSFLRSLSAFTAAGFEANNLRMVLTEYFIWVLRASTTLRSTLWSLLVCSGLSWLGFWVKDFLLPAELALLSGKVPDTLGIPCSSSDIACEASLERRDETCDAVGVADRLRLWSSENLEIAVW